MAAQVGTGVTGLVDAATNACAASAASHTTGNTLTAYVKWENAGTLTSITDTAGNTWVIAAQSGTSPGGALAYALNITGNASNVVTANFSSGATTFKRIIVREWSGIKTASATDGTTYTGSGTGTSYSVSSPGASISTTAPGLVIAGVSGFTGLTGLTAGGSPTFTAGTLVSDTLDIYLVSTSAQSVTPAASVSSGSAAWLMFAQAFLDASPITQQPVSQRVPAGSTATFTVAATGATGYQWQSNVGGTFANISGETSSSYTTGTLTAGTAYAVRCVVTTAAGNSNSDPADVWTPATKPNPWAGLYSRSLARDSVRAWLLTPTSKASGRVTDSALWGVTAPSGVSAALSGQSASFASGSVSPAASVALAGQVATYGLGTLTASVGGGPISVALTGSAVSYAQGALSPASGVALSGAAATFAQGVISAAASLALGGQSATYSQGTLTASVAGNVTVALTGQEITYGQGTLAAATQAALSGQSEAAQAGNLSPALSAGISGQAVTAAAGSISSQTSPALTGSQADYQQGTLGVSVGGDVTVALSGQSAGYSQGALGVSNDSQSTGSGGGAGGPVSAPGGMLHRYKLLQAFKNKQERDQAVAKLPNATQDERVILRKSARALIKSEPVNYKELESRVSKDLESIGLAPAPNHLDWLLYFLRVEAHAIAQAQAQALQDEETMQVLLMALME